MTDIKTLALQCRDASAAIASLPTEAKNALLRAMADAGGPPRPQRRSQRLRQLDRPVPSGQG